MSERLASEARFHEYEAGAHGTHVRARAGFHSVYRLLDHQERDFLSAMGDLRGRRVLSYGCGTGYVTPLARLGARVTGLDISESAIALLRRAIREEGLADLADAEVGDCERTPFPDGTFDLVVGSGILHHLDVDRAGAEIRRVLRPGGRALFREPLATNPVVALYRLLTPDKRTEFERPFTGRDFRALRRHFPWLRWRGYGSVGLAAAALRPYPRLLGGGVRVLAWPDRLVGRVPLVRWLSWTAIIELRS